MLRKYWTKPARTQASRENSRSQSFKSGIRGLLDGSVLPSFLTETHFSWACSIPCMQGFVSRYFMALASQRPQNNPCITQPLRLSNGGTQVDFTTSLTHVTFMTLNSCGCCCKGWLPIKAMNYFFSGNFPFLFGWWVWFWFSQDRICLMASHGVDYVAWSLVITLRQVYNEKEQIEQKQIQKCTI